jgi:hypothetical protein
MYRAVAIIDLRLNELRGVLPPNAKKANWKPLAIGSL